MANETETGCNSKSDASQPAQLARRKFLIKGAAASVPVILTVASRPAMGGNFCTPSGFLSGNLSNPEDDRLMCNGKSPGFWRNRFPHHYKNVKFSTVFGGVWVDGGGTPWNPDATLHEVIHYRGTEDRYKLGAHSVAAYLNAEYRTKLNYPMRTETVVDVVRQVLTMGVYTDPSTGLSMDALEVKSFFQDTYN